MKPIMMFPMYPHAPVAISHTNIGKNMKRGDKVTPKTGFHRGKIGVIQTAPQGKDGKVIVMFDDDTQTGISINDLELLKK